jgi:hypothetical protein
MKIINKKTSSYSGRKLAKTSVTRKTSRLAIESPEGVRFAYTQTPLKKTDDVAATR